MDTTVSILIPTYNRVNLIHRAIESSLNQVYKCEVIVCDHGSNDGTQELCLSYGEKIHYIRREKDYGIHFCELESIIASKGEFIHNTNIIRNTKGISDLQKKNITHKFITRQFSNLTHLFNHLFNNILSKFLKVLFCHCF